MKKEITDFIRRDVKERFLRYVTIDTTADGSSGEHPSSPGQWNLAKLLKSELSDLGLVDVFMSDSCYVYGTMPASPGMEGEALTFCSHMDTSPQVTGKGVRPQIHENYDGGEILFPDDENLVLSPKDSPELLSFIGENIITASGNTLLGADNKAGIAEIMTSLAAMGKFAELKHPELKIVFTPDEEIGQGVDNIDLDRLGKMAVTVDGGMVGEFDTECFDAWGVDVRFAGVNAHPGDSKNIMINAAEVASRFAASLPENETPQCTEKKEGFYHLTQMSGDVGEATLSYIVRDFEREKNRKRIEFMEGLASIFEKRHPGLEVELDVKSQYRNMKEVLDGYPLFVEKIGRAIEMAGIEPKEQIIRGGTDGARLCFLGVPTPNLFTGGLMFHSRKEWVAESAMVKACQAILYINNMY